MTVTYVIGTVQLNYASNIFGALGRHVSTTPHLIVSVNNLIVRLEVMTVTYVIGKVHLNYASNIGERLSKDWIKSGNGTLSKL